MKVWQCSVCRYIHRGNMPPAKCPVCNVGSKKFKEIDEASIPDKKVRRNQTQKKSAENQSSIQGTEISSKTSVNDSDKKTIFNDLKNILIKHHAHPVSVHTPNGILPVAVLLWIVSWIFDSQLMANVATINMIFVVIALPFVIFTGVLEWQKRYSGAMTLVFKLKLLSAALTTVTCIISLIWYFLDPNILTTPKSWVFILINLIMLAAAGIAGHIGGKLVFKD